MKRFKRAKRFNEEEPNHDSFLDIVANLVGILIILVMVVGVRAKEAMVDAAVLDSDAAASLPEGEYQNRRAALAAAQATEESYTQDVYAIENQLTESDSMLAARIQQRDLLLTAVSAVEFDLESRRAASAEGEQADLGLLSQLASSRSMLEQLQSDRLAVENAVHSVAVIHHQPTPLAKTVFGREEHFQLLGGRLAYVPMDTLVEMLKADAPSKISRLQNVSQITESVGPVDDFRLQYTLIRQNSMTDGPLGPVPSDRVELLGFNLLPIHNRLGEPLDMAIAPGSNFERRLAQWDPDQVTITIWTYPDSFGEFRQLKENLALRGFLTAARALPEGLPISGSPEGSRSSGQ